LSSRGTITFTVISRNEYAPRCDVDRNISWSIRENSELGTVIGTISCRDEDKDEQNGRLSVHAQWLLDAKSGDHSIPFEIVTRTSNSSQVTLR
jgi:hypothetical protein